MTKRVCLLVTFVHHSVIGLLLAMILILISSSVHALTIKISLSKGEVTLTDKVAGVTLSYYNLLVPHGSDEASFKLPSLDMTNDRFLYSTAEEIKFLVDGEELQWHVHDLGRRLAYLLASGWQAVLYDESRTLVSPSRIFYYLAADYAGGKLSFRIISAELNLHMSKLKSGHVVGSCSWVGSFCTGWRKLPVSIVDDLFVRE